MRSIKRPRTRTKKSTLSSLAQFVVAITGGEV